MLALDDHLPGHSWRAAVSAVKMQNCWYILLLHLFAASFPGCTAWKYTTQNLEQLIDDFKYRKDTVLLLPMELHLRMRNSSAQQLVFHYTSTISTLTKIMRQRHTAVQRYFYKDYPVQGYVLSDVNRFAMTNDTFILYYYAAFVGTTNLNNLKEQMEQLCWDVSQSSGSSLGLIAANCTALGKQEAAILYNLIVLSSFRFFPQVTTRLLAGYFKELRFGRAQPVVAKNSNEHDIQNLMCRVYLPCLPAGVCKISKVTLSPSIKNRTDWRLFDTYLNASVFAKGQKINGRSTSMFLPPAANDVFDAIYDSSKEDTGIYRSWCENQAGSSLHANFIAITVCTLSRLIIKLI